jgi:hypothetical protein
MADVAQLFFSKNAATRSRRKRKEAALAGKEIGPPHQPT